MTPERVARLVARWARCYTRGLPGPTARRRIDEIDADLHDHIAHERAHGAGEWRIALGIAGRMVRGLPADASWRSTRKEGMKMNPVVRVALVTALVLLAPFVGMQLSDEVNWSLADFVLAGVLLAVTGLLLELASRKPGAIAFRLAAAGIAVAAIAVGEADDAPGLVLFGCLVILGTVALSIRTAQRSD